MCTNSSNVSLVSKAAAERNAATSHGDATPRVWVICVGTVSENHVSHKIRGVWDDYEEAIEVARKIAQEHLDSGPYKTSDRKGDEFHFFTNLPGGKIAVAKVCVEGPFVV
jgi:hypothetical protein